MERAGVKLGDARNRLELIVVTDLLIMLRPTSDVTAGERILLTVPFAAGMSPARDRHPETLPVLTSPHGGTTRRRHVNITVADSITKCAPANTTWRAQVRSPGQGRHRSTSRKNCVSE
ncbi:DUF2381 family protein [Corallococcus exercitus]|uniref:DUF2381 family protein n=1 Tax=Corallococcus exercitus TaxID=2316736 RepID=UPI003F5BB81D